MKEEIHLKIGNNKKFNCMINILPFSIYTYRYVMYMVYWEIKISIREGLCTIVKINMIRAKIDIFLGKTKSKQINQTIQSI
jgi:hypothetical protein